MSKKYTSGPAFPLTNSHIELRGTDWEVTNGISVRDYLAISAFQTRLAKYNDWTLDELTSQAYRDADSMLKARND